MTLPHSYYEDKAIQVEPEELLDKDKFFLEEELDEKSVYQNVSIINEDNIHMDDNHQNNNQNLPN